MFSLFKVEVVERWNFDDIINFLNSQQELLKDRRAIEFKSINNQDGEALDAKIERLAKLQSIINKNFYFLCLLTAVNRSSRKIEAVKFVSPEDEDTVHNKQKAIDNFRKNLSDIEKEFQSNLKKNINNIIFIMDLFAGILGLATFSSCIIYGFIYAACFSGTLGIALVSVFLGVLGLIWIGSMALNYQSPEPEYLVKYHNLLEADNRVIEEALSADKLESLKIKIDELSSDRDSLLDVLIDKEPNTSHQTENTETMTVHYTLEETDKEDLDCFDFQPSLFA